jgi:hypothetical protein
MATEVTVVQLPQGQTTSAASAPVVLASDQVLPLPTGAATQTTLAAISAKLPAALGQQTMSASLGVTVASDQPAIPVASSPSAAVGASSTHHAISAASTNATSVKGSAGTINTLVLCNNATSKRYFKLYNKATAPTVGTDVPVLTYMLPPGETHELPTGAYGLRLSTGIAYATTTGIAVADTAAVSLNDMAIHIGYT